MGWSPLCVRLMLPHNMTNVYSYSASTKASLHAMDCCILCQLGTGMLTPGTSEATNERHTVVELAVNKIKSLMVSPNKRSRQALGDFRTRKQHTPRTICPLSQTICTQGLSREDLMSTANAISLNGMERMAEGKTTGDRMK